jgi:hypothetical protein
MGIMSTVYISNDSNLEVYYEWVQGDMPYMDFSRPGTVAPSNQVLVGEDAESTNTPIKAYILRVRAVDAAGPIIRDFQIDDELDVLKSGLVEHIIQEGDKCVEIVHITQTSPTLLRVSGLCPVS